jgi:hypothetical protein
MKRMLVIILILFSFLSITAQEKRNIFSHAPNGSFSIIVLPDTQEYFGKGTKIEPESQDEISNPVFRSQTKWIAENIDNQKIVFVSHVGDIVDKNVQCQWTKARQYMDVIHGKIPYGISLGNHDMTSDGNSSLFQDYFPAIRYGEFDWYGGYYEANDVSSEFSGNNANSYQLFSAGGIDLLILHLECNAPDKVLNWANDIFNKFKSRFIIVTTHMFLGPLENPQTPEGYFYDPKGVMQWTKRHGIHGNSPQLMWEKCFSKHKNLKLIFCGDQSRTNTMHLELNGNEGNIVHVLLSDYMLEPGPLRIYRFSPQMNEIEVVTYNPIKDSVVTNTSIVVDTMEHNFIISMDLKSYLIK